MEKDIEKMHEEFLGVLEQTKETLKPADYLSMIEVVEKRVRNEHKKSNVMHKLEKDIDKFIKPDTPEDKKEDTRDLLRGIADIFMDVLLDGKEDINETMSPKEYAAMEHQAISFAIRELKKAGIINHLKGVGEKNRIRV